MKTLENRLVDDSLLRKSQSKFPSVEAIENSEKTAQTTKKTRVKA
jgi:hypothetical protein